MPDPAPGARVLELGCRTRAIACELAAWPGFGDVLGVDPSPQLLAKACELADGIANPRYPRRGCARR
jgi:ubiquinone/menaquinone biosynthesis C-methylase UbiE